MNVAPVQKAIQELNAYIEHLQAGGPANTSLVESAFLVLQKSAISSENLPLLRDFQGRVSHLPTSSLTERISALLLKKTDQGPAHIEYSLTESHCCIPYTQGAINRLSTNSAAILRGLSTVFQFAVNPKVREAVYSIPQEQRTFAIIQAITTFFSGTNSHYILRALHNIPQDQRADAIERTLPFLQNTSDRYQIASILQVVAYIPQDQRANVIEKTLPFIQGISDGQEIAYLVQTLKNISSDQREDVIEKTNPLLRGISSGYAKAAVLQAIQDILPEQRDNVIEGARPLLQGISSGFQKADILRAIKDIPQDQREGVIKKTFPLLQDISDGYHRAAILYTIQDILPEQRDNVIEGARPLLQQTSNGYYRAAILRSIEGVLPDQVADAINKTISFLQGISNRPQITCILRAVKDIPPGQRVDVIKQALPLLRITFDGYQRACILQTLKDTPQDQRADVIKKALPLLRITFDGDQRVTILQAVKDIPQDQRADVIEKALPLLQDISDGDQIAAILQTVKDIPQDQRADVIEKALPLLQDISDGDQIATILQTVQDIPLDQRAYVIEKALPFLQSISDGYQRAAILQPLQFISPDKRSKALSILLRAPLQERTLGYLFLKNASIKKASHVYLLARLDLLSAEKEAMQMLVPSILEFSEVFAISEQAQDDLLIQKAIALQIALNPEDQNDPKNPYKIYQDLQMQEPPLDLCPLSYEGFSLDLQGLRNNVDRYEFTLQKIPPKTFQELFTHLQNRLKDPAASKGIEEAFPKQDPHKPERALKAKAIVLSLEENILRGSFIPYYLQIQKLNEKVPSATFYLYSILEALCKMSQTTSPSNPLSEQEIALLSFADAVQSCSAGQQDGISNYYRYVDTSSLQEEEGEEPLFLQISYSIQHVLQETFASHSLLQTLTKETTLSQESHQTLYLKNRLYKQVGLKHHLTFDLHTHALYDPLLQASPSDLLKSFFEECTLEKMILQLQKDLQKLLKKKPGLTGLLRTLLRKEGFLQEMSWNEKINTLELTPKGLCAILQYFHYLKKEEA